MPTRTALSCFQQNFQTNEVTLQFTIRFAEGSGIEPHAGISRTHDLAGRRSHRRALPSK